nr:hypothetical protein [Bacillaceae bacterium]
MAARDARQAFAPHFSAGNRTGRAVRFGWLSIRWKTPHFPGRGPLKNAAYEAAGGKQPDPLRRNRL